MNVIVVKGVTKQQLGYLSRNLFTPTKGVFVGNLSLRVAENLWSWVLAQEEIIEGYWIRKYDNEQGFRIKSKEGNTANIDGIEFFINKKKLP